MATKGRNEYHPDVVSPPGETLQEVLEERGMTQAELAGRTGLARKTINEIIKGKNALTSETALQLEQVFGIPARFWNNPERHYREHLAQTRERELLSKSVDWLKEFPLAEMVRKKYPDSLPRDPVEKVRTLLRFFGVSGFQQWLEAYSKPQFAYRRSKAFEAKPGPLSAWLRMGEIKARAMPLADFDKRRFETALESIRSLTMNRRRFSYRRFRSSASMREWPWSSSPN